MDAMLRCVPSSAEQVETVRSHPLRMRLGVVTAVAKVIEYYVPRTFRRKAGSNVWNRRGEVIRFPTREKKSA